MITDRFITLDDFPILEKSLVNDTHHSGTKPEFFFEPGTACKVYSDEAGPILFAKGSKALRLDLQYVDNSDVKRNMKAMLDGFEGLARLAKENGFREIIFNTNSEMMRKFCVKRFGFVGSSGELRKFI
jgi:hypothetical protein